MSDRQPTPRWQHNLHRFGELDAADKRLFLRAVAALAVARLRLAASSFETLAAKSPHEAVPSGDANVESGGTPPGNANVENGAAPAAGADPDLLQRIGDAVRAAAAHVPWRADCFPQALAARSLLKRHGLVSTVHLGVERLGDDVLKGHAWLTCGGTVVVGGEKLGRYTEIHRFG